MNVRKHILYSKWNVVYFLLFEILIVLIYSLTVVMTFSSREMIFDETEMQLKNQSSVTEGNYLDTSYTDSEAVVTPAFQLQKGIYYIEAFFARQGIVRAGLLYDTPRNGKELVDNDEFIVNPDKQVISYRVKIHDDSKIRFKLRLTGDAVDGDYIQLLKVHIVTSKLTCVYRIFWLIALLVLLDMILWGYVRYYTKWEAERKTVFLVLALTAFFVSLPLFRSGLNEGVDLVFHLSRLEGIYRSWNRGGFQFPVRIQPGWLDGYGYAVSVFYGDIFMYFPAFLRVIGFSLEEAYKAYLGIINIATVFISFYAFRKITRDDVAAMTGSVLYAGGMRVTLMYSVVLGGVSGMTFYPLIVAGFYLLFTEDIASGEYKKIWILLTAGFTGILMTHMVSCLIIGLYSVLLCIVMLKKVLRRNTFVELLKAAGAAVLLSLWYLVPFVQYMLGEKLRINSKIAKDVRIEDYYAALEDFTQEGTNLCNLFTDHNTLGFALIVVILLFTVTIPVQGKGKQIKYCRNFALLALFTVMVCTDLFPVVAIARRSVILTKFFQTIQYQFRFMSVAAVMLACFAALFFASGVFERKNLYWIAGLICCITLYQDMQYYTTLSFDKIYLDGVALEARTNKNIYSYTVGNGEYLPVNTKTTALTSELEFVGDLEVDQIERDGLSFKINVQNKGDEAGEVLFPILYYGGYQAKDCGSREQLETVSGDNGRVAVKIPSGYRGKLQVGFHEPRLWRIAEGISLITLLSIAVYIQKPGRIKRISKKYMQKRHMQA